ncbi:MAG: hypothetical protein MOGMAGMI_01856 [Candidatus Omnitrophica bacterium]|nr:hypothetical protein [Candidatus Omnitrophota bacterium]
MTTTWRDAQGVLAPYLPDLPAEVILRRQRDGLCIYCGQSWCAGCKTTVLEPTPALRAEDV